MALTNYSKTKSNRFKKYIFSLVNKAGKDISGTITDQENVTDGVDYIAEPGSTFNVIVWGAGNISLTTECGSTVIHYDVPAGFMFNGDFVSINSVDTTATNLVAWV